VQIARYTTGLWINSVEISSCRTVFCSLESSLS
jgi:hypothetical protein